MHSNTWNLLASLDDPELFVPMRRLRKTIDARVTDDSDVFSPMKGLREAIKAWVLKWCD